MLLQKEPFLTMFYTTNLSHYPIPSQVLCLMISLSTKITPSLENYVTTEGAVSHNVKYFQNHITRNQIILLILFTVFFFYFITPFNKECINYECE